MLFPFVPYFSANSLRQGSPAISNFSARGAHILLSASPQRRSRHSIISHSNIRIKQNPRIRLLIQTNPQRPSRILRPRARDINIDAERIVLGAIERAGAVAGDDFVAEYVVAWAFR